MAGELDKYFSDTKIPDHLKKSDIKSIQDWLIKQRHLPDLSDKQISVFLHSCFGGLELTKTTIDSYYTIRTHAPELFNGRTPKEVAETSNVIYWVILDQVCPDGCRIVLLGLSNPDPSKFNLVGYLRSLLCVLDILYNEHSFDEGIRIVYDMTGACFGHLAKLSVGVLKKSFVYLQGCHFDPINIFRRCFVVRYVSGLPELSLEKHHLMIAGLYDENAEKFSVQKAVKMFFGLLDLEANIDRYAVGWRVIISAKGFSLGHLTRITANMSIVKKAICYLQDGLPLRLKGIHIFNAIPLVNQFLAFIRPIMKKELYDLIHVHSTNDIESLFEFIPQECLPSNFGGKAPSVDELIKISNEKMEKYKQWFVDDDKLGRVDESKRAGKAKNSGDIFGFDGSFKKLDFD